MKRYSFEFLSYLKFLAIFVLIISLFASCGTDDQDLVDADVNVDVNAGTTINENNGTQIIVNSGDVYINQDTDVNYISHSETQSDYISNDDLSNTTTTSISTTITQISNNATNDNSENKNNILLNDDVELIIHSSNSCTGHISNDYITKYYIGRTSGDFKTIGWSIYMKTDTDSMSIAVEIDWEDEESGNLRAVGIYQNEGTIQNGIDFSITDEGLFIELNSNNLPFDLYDVNYIEIQNISEII